MDTDQETERGGIIACAEAAAEGISRSDVALRAVMRDLARSGLPASKRWLVTAR